MKKKLIAVREEEFKKYKEDYYKAIEEAEELFSMFEIAVRGGLKEKDPQLFNKLKKRAKKIVKDFEIWKTDLSLFSKKLKEKLKQKKVV